MHPEATSVIFLFFILIGASSASSPNLSLYLLSSNGSVISKGEGFFICENIMMTARHVLYSGIDFVSTIKAKYHYSDSYQYEVTGILYEYEDYDVAIVSIRNLSNETAPVQKHEISFVNEKSDENGVIVEENTSEEIESMHEKRIILNTPYNDYLNVSSDVKVGFDVFMRGTLNEEQWKTCACIGGIQDDLKFFTMRIMSNIVGFSGTPVLNSNSEIIGMLINGTASPGIQGLNCYAITMCYLFTEILTKFINEMELSENGTIVIPPNGGSGSLVQMNHPHNRVKIDLCHPENSDLKSIKEAAIYLCEILHHKETFLFEDWIKQARRQIFNYLHSIHNDFVRIFILTLLHEVHILLVSVSNISVQTLFNTTSILVVSVFLWTKVMKKMS